MALVECRMTRHKDLQKANTEHEWTALRRQIKRPHPFYYVMSPLLEERGKEGSD